MVTLMFMHSIPTFFKADSPHVEFVFPPSHSQITLPRGDLQTVLQGAASQFALKGDPSLTVTLWRGKDSSTDNFVFDERTGTGSQSELCLLGEIMPAWGSLWPEGPVDSSHCC